MRRGSAQYGFLVGLALLMGAMPALGLAPAAQAGIIITTEAASTDRADQARPQVSPFDGVWVGPGEAVTLLTALPESVLLQGKDAAAAWSATCVRRGQALLCRGQGVIHTQEGRPFIYESTVTIIDGSGDALDDSWTITVSGGGAVEGQTLLRRAPWPSAKP